MCALRPAAARLLGLAWPCASRSVHWALPPVLHLVLSLWGQCCPLYPRLSATANKKGGLRHLYNSIVFRIEISQNEIFIILRYLQICVRRPVFNYHVSTSNRKFTCGILSSRCRFILNSYVHSRRCFSDYGRGLSPSQVINSNVVMEQSFRLHDASEIRSSSYS